MPSGVGDDPGEEAGRQLLEPGPLDQEVAHLVRGERPQHQLAGEPLGAERDGGGPDGAPRARLHVLAVGREHQHRRPAPLRLAAREPPREVAHELEGERVDGLEVVEQDEGGLEPGGALERPRGDAQQPPARRLGAEHVRLGERADGGHGLELARQIRGARVHPTAGPRRAWTRPRRASPGRARRTWAGSGRREG